MKEPADWRAIDTSGDPILVVGRRPRPKQLEGFVVDLDVDTHGIMRDIVATTVTALASRSRLDWHPDAHIEQGEEYLTVSVSDLPSAPRRRHRGNAREPDQPGQRPPPDPLLAEAADLLRVVLAPGELDNLHPAELAEGNFRLYAIVWEAGDQDGPVAFVSEYDPTAILRKAHSFFRFDGTLRAADPPDFTLDRQADLIVTRTEIAILNPTVFNRLFADIRALLNDVPAYTKALKKALKGLPMSSASELAIEQVCATRPSYARRLQNLAASPGAASITASTLRAVLRRHSQDPGDFLRSGSLEIGPAQVPVLLDVAEGRWYEADFTSEPRRAARWSRR